VARVGRFDKLLIANRGEIACRIVRTARRMGLRTVAVYSDADRDAMHVALADEALRIGPPPAKASYLDIAAIVAAARKAGAGAVHPGYGFLSENADFAQACADASLIFVGPAPETIRLMGSKSAAKALMQSSGVPVVPGYHGTDQSIATLTKAAEGIGYPVLIKAVAGGGGKGMRKVKQPADFDAALASAQREAQAAFGDPRVLIEKYVTAPRHIEIQVFADRHGNVIHLNERDCSLQRRHQKVIEEAPAPGMSAALRAAIGAAAVKAAQAVGYVGAGTVEFIADGTGGLKQNGFWFMEMNTRLQVEHPVTEVVTGLDLVEWQFRVAAGERLPLTQERVPLKGHAVEARVYAEDPEHGFLPSTGKLLALRFPEAQGVRIDTGVEEGDAVTPYYDPMIAKMIAHGGSRDQALDRLADALELTVVIGPHSNAGFLAALVRAPEFRRGAFDTGFIDAHLAELGAVPQPLDKAAAALGAREWLTREQTRIAALEPGSPWDAEDGFQLSGERRLELPLIAEGEGVIAHAVYGRAAVSVTVDGEQPAGIAVADADAIYVVHRGRQTRVGLRDVALDRAGDSDTGGVVRAPMHGKVLAVTVEKGERVHRGQRLAIIEAMKMEHALTAPNDGIVAEIAVAAGAQVDESAAVMRIEAVKD